MTALETGPWRPDVLPTASLTRRAVAFGLDSLIIFGLAWTLTFLAAALGILRIPDIAIIGRNSPAAGLLWIVSIFELPLLLAYFTLLENRTGRTPGKAIFGLRVQHADGTPPSLKDAFVRNLLRLLWVTPIGSLFILLDAYVLRVTELDQRIGDLAAGVVVVRESD